MTLAALVLVHGGQHAADCWDATVDEIHRRAPGLAVLSPDLPGRRDKPGDLLAASIDDWVDSLLADIEDSGLEDTCHNLMVSEPTWLAEVLVGRCRQYT